MNNKKMLRFFSWITLATFLPFSLAIAAPAGQFVQTSGYVSVTNPAGITRSASSGEAVESGQTVTLGDGARAVLRFQDGQVIALQSKSIFKVNNYKFEQAAPEKGESFFSLLQGGLRAVTGLIGASNRAGWKLATPTSTIGIRGTDFLVVIDQVVYLRVDVGAIGATNSAGTAVVGAGQTAVVSSATALGTIVPATSIPSGTFGELGAINLGAGSGAAAGASAAGGTILGVPTGVVIGVGVVGAAAAAAASSSSTTSHH